MDMIPEVVKKNFKCSKVPTLTAYTALPMKRKSPVSV